MSIQTLNLTPQLYDYLLENSLREHPVLTALRAETKNFPGNIMQISPEQGQFMLLLMELINAKKTLDIGTYTGYSALVVALAMRGKGKVITCDINVEATDVAKRYWQKAQMDKSIELKLAPALETLNALIAAGEVDSFDFAFIDADKNNYRAYYEAVLTLLRTGGVIAIDNVLWSGAVADSNVEDKQTIAIRELNKFILTDERVTISMLPIGDGLTLARKR